MFRCALYKGKGEYYVLCENILPVCIISYGRHGKYSNTIYVKNIRSLLHFSLNL